MPEQMHTTVMGWSDKYGRPAVPIAAFPAERKKYIQ
jgi:hypothetical protein